MHRKTFLLALAVLVCFQITPLHKQSLSKIVSSTTDCDWPAWGKSAGHDRVADESCGPNPATMGRLWEFKVDDNLCSSASIWDGKVFVGSEKRALCLKIETGEVVWEYKTDSKTWSPPTIANGLLYMGIDDNKALCLNADTGNLVWTFATNGAVIRPPTVSDGRAFVGSNDKIFYCLDANTGSKIWEYQTEGAVTCHPVVDNGLVYFVSQDKKVYCLKENNGAKLWEYLLPDVSVTGIAMKNRRIYLGCNDGNLYCLNPITGSLVWSYKTDGAVKSSPAIDDNMVYFGSDDGNLYALNLSSVDNATLAWKFKTGDKVFSSPAICGKYVYFGSDDKKVYCLDKTNGSLVWSEEHGDRVWGSPSIAYGCMLVGSASNTLVCYGNNEDNCDWPSFGRNSNNNRIVPDECDLSGNAVRVKWEVKIGESAIYPPIIVNNRIFVGSDDKNIYCFNCETGEKYWCFETNGLVVYPVYYKNKLYFSSDDGTFYCLNPENGTKTWEYITGRQGGIGCAIIGDCVFFGDWWSDNFYCLDANTGEEKWIFKAIGGIAEIPVLYDGKVYYGTSFEGKKFYCLDQKTGNKIWELETESSSWTPSVSNGRIYFASLDKLYCVNADTGEKEWTSKIGETLLQSPVIYNNKIYCGNKVDEFYCLDEINGKILWQIKFNGDLNFICPGSPIICNGKIYHCNDESVYCIDAENGKILWEHKDNGGISGDPRVSNGFMYYGTGVGDGRFVCLEGYNDTQPKPPPNFDCNDCKKYMQFTINSPYWNICGNGQPAMSASPVISYGRTFLVIRNIAETIGAQVSWDGSSKTTTISLPSQNLTIELQIGDSEATVNGKSTYIDSSNHDVKPFISGGRTMLPLRFITENLGLEINWDSPSRTATVFYKDPKCLLESDFDFILKDTAGKTHQLSKYRGKPVLLDFMASWCTPCKEAAPIIKNIAKEYGNKLYVFSIDLRERIDKVKELKDELGAGWPFLLDSDGAVAERFKVKGIPHFVLIDSSGSIKFEYDGYSSDLKTILEQQIDRLIK